MYDPVCRFLVENFSQDFARWLLGEPIALTTLSPTELSLQPIRADALILLQSEEMVLHLEFQSEPDPEIPFRLLDYRVRVYRRYPNKRMKQVVIYLKSSNSRLVYQNSFSLPGTRHEFEVVRLWEMPSEEMLKYRGLYPLAALGRSDNREGTLREVAQRIETLADKTEQSNLAASTAILAGLVIDKEVIRRLLRQEIMRESVIYQDIRAEGRQEEGVVLILRQLKRRLGNLPTQFEEPIRQLSIEQLENLGEALLDFESEADLTNWLSQSGN